MIYADFNEQRVEATPRAEGYCPLCKERLISKCGEILCWHWSHKAGADCDKWNEPESDWHRGWKKLFPPECCEVVMGPHRADIVTPQGIIVELQSSSINPAKAREREEFYRNMIWLFRAEEFFSNLQIRFEHRWGSFDRISFQWQHPRRTHALIRKPLFWDLCDGRILEVSNISHNGCYGYGRLQSSESFAKALLQSHAHFVPMWLQARESFKDDPSQLNGSPPAFGEGVPSRRSGSGKTIAGQGILF